MLCSLRCIIYYNIPIKLYNSIDYKFDYESRLVED